jgi:RNA polymerase sigma-70 factor (ECF subfamily)
VLLDAEERRRFDEALLPHLDAAFNLARWLTRDGHAAEDVVQDAFHRALRFFHGFRGQDGRTWLLAIVRHSAYDWLKKQRLWEAAAQFNEELHDREDEALNPEHVAVQRANREMLLQAMEKLPAEFREVTVLRELEGLSYKEIAAVTGAPVGTVMSRLSRARRQLQELLAQCLGAGGAS